MAIYQIDDKYRITTDKYNYILEKLEKTKSQKTGETKEQWTVVGYYGNSLNALFYRLLNEKIKENLKEDIKAFTKELNKIYEQLESHFKNGELKEFQEAHELEKQEAKERIQTTKTTKKGRGKK